HVGPAHTGIQTVQCHSAHPRPGLGDPPGSSRPGAASLSPHVTWKSVISRVAVLPQAPLLVPELMGASVAGSEPMRSACLDAAARLAEASRDWVVLAPASTPGSVGPDSRGSFRGYGANVVVSLGGDAEVVDETLPLPALIAGWLRERVGAHRV